MKPTDYWEECLADALQENNIVISLEQIKNIAHNLSIAHDNYSMCFYEPPTSELPVFKEVKELRIKLEKEFQKRGCSECNGRGSITSNFGTRSSTSKCYHCKGEGKI